MVTKRKLMLEGPKPPVQPSEARKTLDQLRAQLSTTLAPREPFITPTVPTPIPPALRSQIHEQIRQEDAMRERVRQRRRDAESGRSDLARLFGPETTDEGHPRLSPEQRRVRRDHDTHAAATKATIGTWDALLYVANNGVSGRAELLTVARDITSRGHAFVSERQFSYGKSICLKPYNRALLEARYDLSAMRAESFVAQPHMQPTPTSPFTSGERWAFNAVLKNAFESNFTITVRYNADIGGGRTRESVRTIQIPRTMGAFHRQINDAVTAIVDAEWLYDLRRIDPRRIPGAVARP